ncbi:hypothetical protein ACHAW6_008779 [Cyclotella cf. meneghiniana]
MTNRSLLLLPLIITASVATPNRLRSPQDKPLASSSNLRRLSEATRQQTEEGQREALSLSDLMSKTSSYIPIPDVEVSSTDLNASTSSSVGQSNGCGRNDNGCRGSGRNYNSGSNVSGQTITKNGESI